MIRELFYYILGGVTFLPLCLFAGLIHFHLTAPLAGSTDGDERVPSDLELTQERKVMALDLAAANAALLSEIENNKGKDRPQGSTTAPAAAKRLGPVPTSGTKPHLSGWLTVRPRFEGDAETSSNSAPNLKANAHSTQANAGTQAAGSTEPGQTLEADKKAVAGTGGGSYMSQMYKGLLDYRTNRAGAKKPNTASAPAASSKTTYGAGNSQADPSLTGTTGKEGFHCILKAPILYLYSSDDVSNPNTECHAAIDLRGKRVSIFVSGIGDTMGEPSSSSDEDDPGDDNDNDGEDQLRPSETLREQQGREKPLSGPLAAIKSEAGAYDTQSSAGSDAEAFQPPDRSGTKFAKTAWKRAKRVAVRDGELFMRRNAIRILGSFPGRSGARSQRDAPGQGHRQRPQWFLFCKNTTSMEDWYHALLQASFMPESSLKPEKGWSGQNNVPHALQSGEDRLSLVFSREDMASLLVSLDSLPDPIPLRWLNAMVGRIFYSVYRTAWLEDYITRKMMKKISRVKTPGFLGDIKVREVDVGRRAPGFSRPMLKSLTSDGEASMEVACHYTGEVRITVSTSLTISLGSRFKPYSISLVLAVVLRSLEGNLLLQVKPPPSNRLWFGFTSLPKMEIDVEPVVSERKVQWGMVTRLIESRIKELLTESIVVPNMDDVPFFDTRSFPYRGAIFADAAKRADDSLSSSAASETAKASQAEAPAAATAASTTATTVAAHQSAPVSGAATPESFGREKPENAVEKVGAPVHDGQSSATVEKAAGSLRNRKSSTLKPVADQQQQQPQQPQRLSSPAAAGLSDLLSRDLAAGGGLSTSPSRSDSRSLQSQAQSQPQNRKSWFGSTSRMSSTSSAGSGSSALHTRSKHGKGREQSSLAWGNASLSHVPGRNVQQQQQQQQLSPKMAPSQDGPAPDEIEALDEPTRDAETNDEAEVIARSGGDVHRRNNKSISSISSSVLGTDESGASATTDQLNASIEAAAMESMDWEPGTEPGRHLLVKREDDIATPTSEHHSHPLDASKAPSLLVSKTSEDDVSAMQEGFADIRSKSSEPGPVESDEQNGPLSSLDVSNTEASSILIGKSSSYGDAGAKKQPSMSSLHSSRNTSAADLRKAAEASRGDGAMSGSPHLSKSAEDLGFGPRGYDGKPVTRTTTSNSTTSSLKSSHGSAPPPPPRRPTGSGSSRPQDEQRSSDAISGLSATLQNRYGLGGGTRDQASTTQDGQPSTAATVLLNSWTKAKASMADKESRQAAAKDAKDAIRRGWANWNAKRTERSSGTSQSGFSDAASISSTNTGDQPTSTGSSRASLVPSRSSWFGNTSPTDPTSLGTGLERERAERSADTALHFRSEAERRAKLRQNQDDDRGDTGSARSSSSSRQPYRELRASKAGHQSAQVQADQATDDGEPERRSSAHWTAEVPSLAAPAPAFQRKAANASPQSTREQTRSLPGSSSQGSLNSSNGSTGSDLPRRRVGSTASGGASGGLTFMPPAPTTTTSLASTSGFSDSGLSPLEGASPADGNSPLPTPSATSQTGTLDLNLSAPPAALSADREGQDKQRPSPSQERLTLSPPMHMSPRLYSAEGFSSPNQSPALSATAKVQTQPGRAPMMAVPGIPSMQKSIPQSFSAPPPPADSQQSTGSNAAAARMGSMFKRPVFGSGAGARASPGAGAGSGGGADASVRSASAEAGSRTIDATGRGARDEDDAGGAADRLDARGEADAAPAGLGLVDMTPAKGPAVSDEVGRDSAPVGSYGEGVGTAEPLAGAGRPTPTGADEGGGGGTEAGEGTFAQVAASEGPAVDSRFAASQMDMGPAVEVGRTEVKLADGSRENRENLTR